MRRADKEGLETAVLIAEPLSLPIDKGLAGPGMLADTIVKRWCDHQPAHRQESIYARDGLELARSTICYWQTTLQQEEAKRRLDENPLRRALLAFVR